MISSRRLAQMARKWLNAAAAGRKRIAVRRRAAAPSTGEPKGPSSVLAGKGHFVVYSGDGVRFEVPLTCLKSDVFRELLSMSEDVFGLPGAGPITLPCDAAFVDRVVSCLRRGSSRDVERELLASLAARRCSEALAPCSLQINQQLVTGC